MDGSQSCLRCCHKNGQDLRKKKGGADKRREKGAGYDGEEVNSRRGVGERGIVLGKTRRKGEEEKMMLRWRR